MGAADPPSGTITTGYEDAARQDSTPDAGAAVARRPPQPGDRIGRYIVEHTLGQGGMGVVVAARDPELTRLVAIKVVRGDVGDPAYRARLVREARTMAKLEHPNVVRVYDAGQVDGEVFVAMELVRGDTLGGWLRAAPRPWREVVARFVAAGRGLAAAHHAGLVHRDFKPGNVLVRTDGLVCVTDFGLAIPVRQPAQTDAASAGASAGTAVDGDAALTRDGTRVGTPAYMAPEQRSGGDVDARADIYSFCVSLYQGLYGMRPFPDEPSLSTTVVGGADVPRPPSARGVPRAVWRSIERGLARDPEARWPTIDPLLAELERAARPRRLVPMVVPAAVAMVAIAAAVLAVWRNASGGQPSSPAPAPFVIDRATRLTFAAGCEAQPAFLRDGRVVYARPAGLASTLHITGRGPAGDDALGPGSYPAVSPSGHQIAALDRKEVVVYDLDRPGAPPRSAGTSSSAPAWLDDRELIVGVDDRIVARAVQGGAERVIGRLPTDHALRAATVGRDGRVFVIYRADMALAEDLLAEVLPGGALRALRRGVYWQGGLRYRPAGNRIYFVQRMNTTQFHLFAQSALAPVEPVPLINDTPPTGGFDVVADGRTVVFSTCIEAASLFRIADDGTLTAITQRGNWRDSSPVVVDADRLVYTSTRGGELQLWLHSGAAHRDRPLTAPESSYAALSPDRRTLVYAAFNAGGTDALVARELDDATTERKLTGGHLDRAPVFTRDGRSVLFLRDTPAGIRLYRMALAGGVATEVLSDEVRAFDVSPRDESLLVVTRIAGRDHLRIVTPTGAAHDVRGADILGKQLRFVRFSRDGTGAIAVDDEHGAIVQIELATGAARVRWRLQAASYSGIRGFDVDSDGRSLVVTLVSIDGDLWRADGRF